MNKVVLVRQPDTRIAAAGAAMVAALMVGAPFAVCYLSWELAHSFGTSIFLIVAGVSVVGAAIAGAVLSSELMLRRVLRGFELICEQAKDPYFLTDDDCNLIRANPAAWETFDTGDFGPNKRLGTRKSLGDALPLSEALRPWSDRSDEIVYRLSRCAQSSWGVPERVGGSTPRFVTVRRLHGDLLMWRVETPSTFAPFHESEAAFPVFRLDAEAALQQANSLFDALEGDTQAALIEGAGAAVRVGETSASVMTSDGVKHTLAIAIANSGEASVFALARQETSGETLGRLLEHLPVALARMRADGELVSVNAAARKLLGDRAVKGAALEKLVEGFGRPIGAQVRDAAQGRGAGRTEQARGRVEGRDVFLQIALTRAPDDERGELIAVLSDATELKTLEQQFVQSQKMQAVGQMAGGVAHDFNNLLTAIIGHCDLLMLRTDQAQPEFADLTQIKQNANRAAALVRQLLAFSRKQTLKPKPVSLSDTLNELSHLLNRLLGETVHMELDHGAELWPVWIDEQQFEQVIVNLAVNARDAMPAGGTVTARVWNRVLSTQWNRDRAVVPPGDYVCIKVTDTGVGMDEDTMGKVFEPFFTTKRLGEGTGLGLSTAYGIIKQMDGYIFVDSAPGKGTSFTILLPRMMNAPAIEAEAKQAQSGDLTGSGAILLVEDEAPVRAFAARALKLRGYDVLEADCAEAALTILADESVVVDLMISDVVMPGLDGPTWVRAARQARPEVGVIFISGYAEGVFRNGMEDIDNYTFLAKPFVLDELAAAVKKALEGTGGEREGGS